MAKPITIALAVCVIFLIYVATGVALWLYDKTIDKLFGE
jgi:hypothetical protein